MTTNKNCTCIFDGERHEPYCLINSPSRKARSNKHRGEVIEIYENGLRAAVKFSSGRIECVVRRGMAPEFYIGQRGMVDYVRSLNGFEWTFNAFKTQRG